MTGFFGAKDHGRATGLIAAAARGGFTLIELMIVMTIIRFWSALATIHLHKTVKRAGNQYEADLASMRQGD